MWVYAEVDPDDNLRGRAVDPPYHLDLTILLFAIGLINAHIINLDLMLLSLSV
jgi:hypothetical protein